MDKHIRISKTWLIIIAIGTILFLYGKNSGNELLEALGAIAAIGSLFCGLSDIIIRLIRRKM